MHRGVYFDGWFPGQHNYHPSLPARRLKMIDDLVDMKATMLVWSALGGGSISLPYLEDEAFGDIPERFRIYGFVNDSEFIRHAQSRGIDVYGIVFECQGWEFPARLTGGAVTALNELSDDGEHGWLGLREFTQNTGPDSWKPFSHYFPDGLRNSRGEVVTDLWEECASRDLDGKPLHADWVEVNDMPQENHYMDRNNPVWREYLKAIIRIQIDAGVAGVQLDEADSPLGALRYGGCFCPDCVSQFRDYLQEQQASTDDPVLRDLELDDFDYAAHLRANGFHAGDSPLGFPLYSYFSDFNVVAVNRTFKELADYIRAYGRSIGRDVKVAGNFYNCFGEHDPMVTETDVLVAEMQLTGTRQPWWFRHARAFARGREVVIVENPYGGVIPDLVTKISHGRGWDQFRTSIYEGAAMGVGMSLPYGSWLGSEIEDSFSVPKELADECGAFLEEIDALRSTTTRHTIAALYSLRDNLRAELDGGKWNDLGADDDGPTVDTTTDYWHLLHGLDDAGIPYDSVILPDTRLRPNDVTAGSLARYDTIIAANCALIGSDQNRAVLEFLDAGGLLVVVGDYGTLLGAEERGRVLEHDHTTRSGDVGSVASTLSPDASVDAAGLISVSIADLEDGVAIHLINYDTDGDTVRPHEGVTVSLPTLVAASSATLHRPGRPSVDAPILEQDGVVTVNIDRLDTYAVIHLH